MTPQSLTTPAALEATPFARLHATAPAPLPFAHALHVRAFLLEREAGNLVVYAAPALAGHARAFAALGGVAQHRLGHWHEAGFGAGVLDAPLVVHAADRERVQRTAPVAAAFDRRHALGDDLEVVPVPGHTPGSAAYLWDSGEHRFLFTADSLYLHEREWVAAVLRSSDRAAYIESLALLRELSFDVLVPWAASAGEPFFAATDRADAVVRIDAVIDRLRRGGHR